MIKIILSLTTVLASCGVEVGNPQGEVGKDDKGRIIINIANVNDSEIGKRFEVGFEELQLRSSSDEELVSTISTTDQTIDILKNEDIENQEIVNFEIQTGSFDSIVVKLNDKAVIYEDKDNKISNVKFADSTHKAFYLNTNFEIVSGETTELTINLDPRSSLHKEEDGFTFRPKGFIANRRHGVRHTGEIERDDGEIVCAYLYRPLPKPPRRPGPPKQFFNLIQDPDPRRPPPGFNVEDRPFFETREDLIKDETSDCENAFWTSRIIEDKYEFRHLRPGFYDIRVFYRDQTFLDIETELELKPEVPPR